MPALTRAKQNTSIDSESGILGLVEFAWQPISQDLWNLVLLNGLNGLNGINSLS